MPDRLFLFAGFNKDCIIDDALVYYVKNLSRYGDVILCMDCDCPKKETEKLKNYTIHTIAKRHGEYDFGSYKRCFKYAKDKKLLNKYDYVYLVNDSVFGPMFDIKQTIKNIESLKTDAAGIVISNHKTHSFMESWFVRLNKKIFLSTWFDAFMNSVKKETNKDDVTIKYEHGLSNLIKNNNCSWSGLYSFRGRYTYNHPKSLFKKGCPFVKKMSFTRHNGSLGRQIKWVLNHADKKSKTAVIDSANNLYGEKYMNWFLTSNPLKIIYRNTKYLIHKIRNK